MKNRIFRLLIFIAVSAGLGYILGTIVLNRGILITVDQLWYLLLFFLLALFMTVNTHEFGHFVIGKLLGYKLIRYSLGFLNFRRENGKMRFSILRTPGIAGSCAMIPDDESLGQFTFYIAGGVLFNLLSGLLFIGLAYIVGSDILSMFFIIWAGTSLILFTSNILPSNSKGNVSDGSYIWSVISRNPNLLTLSMIIKAQTKLALGFRPRELNIHINPHDEFSLLLYLYSYFKSIDGGDPAKTDEIVAELEKNMDKVNALNHAAVCYELCYWSCIKGELEKAKSYYENCSKVMESDEDVNGMRVKAYYEYYVNNDTEKAEKLCRLALNVVDKYPIKGQGLLEEELVVKLQLIMQNNR